MNNQIIDLKETLEIMHAHRSIDICVLFVSTRNLRPFATHWEWVGVPRASDPEPNLPGAKFSASMKNPFMAIEDIASLLSRGHESSPKDETVIPSLLIAKEEA